MHFTNIDIKFVFSTFKVKQLFIVKDFVPQGLRSHVVYKFTYAGCNANYIGETTRHVSSSVLKLN